MHPTAKHTRAHNSQDVQLQQQQEQKLWTTEGVTIFNGLIMAACMKTAMYLMVQYTSTFQSDQKGKNKG